MREKKIVVPNGMCVAVMNHAGLDGRLTDPALVRADLASALAWLSENPIVPTSEQYSALMGEFCVQQHNEGSGSWVMREWQRRMFLAPEPEFPEIADVLKDFRVEGDAYYAIIEAYRRGKGAHLGAHSKNA
jgi:hypothetical protein